MTRRQYFDINSSEPYFDFRNANYDLLKYEVNGVDWQNLLRDYEIEQAVNIFYRTIYGTLENTVPLKHKKKSNA